MNTFSAVITGLVFTNNDDVEDDVPYDSFYKLKRMNIEQSPIVRIVLFAHDSRMFLIASVICVEAT